MKKYTILNILIVALAIGLMAFYSTKNDKAIYEQIAHQDKQHTYNNNLMRHICNKKISSMEHAARDSKDFEVFKNLAVFVKEVEKQQNEVIQKTAQIRDKFLVMPNMDDVDFTKFVFPLDYNSQKPVRKAFKSNAAELAQIWTTNKAVWQETITNLQLSNPNFNEDDFKTLKTDLQAVFDRVSAQEGFLSEQQILEDIKNADVLHAEIYTRIIEQKLLNALCETLNLCLIYIEQFKAYGQFDNYKILMASEKRAKVGEAFNADFFIVNYADDLDFTMRVNGRTIPVKNGIGYYEYTPTTSGEKAFRTDISMKNRYRDRIDSFSKTFRLEVIDE